MPDVAIGALTVGLGPGAGGGVGGARYLTGVSAVGGSWNPRAASCRQINQRAGDGIISGQKGRRTVQVLNAGSMSNNCVGATMNGLQGSAKCGP